MDTISDILTQKYSYQGIQDIFVYQDSIFFNLKVKKDLEYYNLIFIEKISFDYDKNILQKIDNGLVLNFGNTESSQAFKTNGNCFIKAFLQKNKKNVILAGIKSTINNNTVPVIYSYNINNHSYKLLFPTQKDSDNFDNFDNFEFNNNFYPTAEYNDDVVKILFQSKDNNNNYLNIIKLKIKNEDVNIKEYDIFKYDKNHTLDFKDMGNNNLIFSYNLYNGFCSKL